MMKNANLAFTLAEVLVTLAIIGVIAAMSVPSLIQTTNQAELKTKWKKEFAQTSQALQRMASDNDGDLSDALTTDGMFMNMLCGYMTCTKSKWRAIISFTSTPAFDYVDLAGNPITQIMAFDDGQVELNDGTFIAIDNSGGTNYSLTLWVDVNGYQKGPNQLGRDFFGMMLTRPMKNSPRPLGAAGTVAAGTCGCDKTSPCAVSYNGSLSISAIGAGCSSTALYGN